MGGRRNERKKREREEEGVQGERKRKKKKKGKKKSSVGFKPFRLFLLLSCLCNGRRWLEGLVSLFFLPGSHSSLFCRCGPWQAIRPLISQSSSFVLGTRKRRLQLLWLGTRASSAGESSCFGFVTVFCALSAQPADQSSRPGLGRWRAGCRFSRLGVRTLASSFVLGKRASSRPCAL